MGFTMASTGAAIRSVTRPLRAVVKPAQYAAEHPSRATSALVASSGGAVASHGGAHDDHYAWGVHWPGHNMNHQPTYDLEAVKDSFKRWKDFRIVDPEIALVMKMMASSAIANKLPSGGGH